MQSMTPEQTKVVFDWLAKKQVSRQCPACKQAQMSVGGCMVALPLMWGGDGRQLIPVSDEVSLNVQLVCTNCLYTMYFLADTMGVL